jgi:predicted PurR-regulated permease PerM
MNAASKSTEITRYILIAIALVLVAAMLWLTVDAWVIGFGAIVFATVLRAAAEPIQGMTHLSERWSVVVAVVLLLILFALLSWLFGAQTARQFAELRDRLPEAVSKLQEWLQGSATGRAIVDGVKQALGNGDAAANFGVAAGAALGGLGNLLLILFAGIYFALDPRLYRNGALRLLPPSRRAQVGSALDDAGISLKKWLVAQLIVMLAVGVLTGTGLALLGVPLALSLGLLIGILEFVPVLGPIVAAVPGVLLAFAKGPETAVYALAIYVAVQQVESNLLTPLIQRWAVELPPVVALLSIVACGLLFGVMGVLFATPMAVVGMVLVRRLYVEDTLENGAAQSPAKRSRAATAEK